MRYSIDDVTCTKESDSGKALLMESDTCDEFEGGDGKCWIPKSQITEDSDVHSVGDSGTLQVTRWLAEEKGWM